MGSDFFPLFGVSKMGEVGGKVFGGVEQMEIGLQLEGIFLKE